ncbi:MAG TPA: phenylalanine--tRNA ligase subunit alpha [Candidatus Paceibacterota bacterium]
MALEADMLKKKALGEISKAEDVRALETLRVFYLGRKSKLSEELRGLGGLSLNERKKNGPVLHALRREFEEAFLSRSKEIGGLPGKTKNLDLTMPGKKVRFGHLHPLTKIENEIKQIFRSMNFSVIEGPEVENEYYNFDALNIPASHPAREMWDTFWLKESEKNVAGRGPQKSRLLLRTHTSPIQIRYMESHKPPFQIIVPGRVFRYEATDASHEINFYQVEGLMVGENVSVANFKFVIEEFFKKLFSSGGGSVSGRSGGVEFRFRPSYFPFVEPGLEVDIKLRGGKWLEVLGAGMVHPRVFEAAGYNPRDLQGFAFGVGLDRLAMIKYKVPDIRLFYSGDLRFIRQF